ncbi:E3 ubiquitin-protein ligase TRIM21-like [Rhinophrynus dorsalis]
MASAALRGELNCSICMSIYTNPVCLSCGHNFCEKCIAKTLDYQEEYCHGFSCPECRMKFKVKPALQKNLKLCNIAEHYLSTQSINEDAKVFCTYCMNTPIPALKSFQYCEISMCDKHLMAHNTSKDSDKPNDLMTSRKCPIHNQSMDYYCSDDNTCICVSFCVFGIHKGHQVDMLNEASTNMKDRVTGLFTDIREQLNIIENRVETEISNQLKQASDQLSDHIKQLEIQKNELSQEIHYMEEVHSIIDPITFLKEWSTVYGTWDGESGSVDYTCTGTIGCDFNEVFITINLQNGLLRLNNIMNNLKTKKGFSVEDASSLLLDINTAANNLVLSDDLKTANYSNTEQSRSQNPERFKLYQVLSKRSFHSGQHYWEVDVSDTGDWRIGVAFPSIERRGIESFLRYNNRSWSLNWDSNHLTYWSNYQLKSICTEVPLCALGIYLDYEAGLLAFYRLADQIVPLCTITTIFSEPLHAFLCQMAGFGLGD